MKSIFVSIIACLLMVTASFAQDAGNVDWTEGIVTATGYGTAKPSGSRAKDKIKALRVAKLLASRSLLETIKGVHIDGRTLVVDGMLKKEVVATRVDGMIRAARVVKQDVRAEDDGSIMAEVELAVCLTGRGACKGMPNLAEEIDLEAAKASPAVPEQDFESGDDDVAPSNSGTENTQEQNDVTAEEILAAVEPTESAKPETARHAFDAAKPATGLIVRVAGRFKPTLLPVLAVKGDNGKMRAVYSVKVIDPEVYRDRGMAVYPASLSEASRLEELGDNVIMASGRPGADSGLVVLDEKDARVIFEQARRGSDFLKTGHVAICAQ